GDLDQRGALRHHDLHAEPQACTVEGDPLRVVARTRGHDPGRALLCGNVEDSIERTSILEGSGALEVFQLEPGVSIEQLTDPFRGRARRSDDLIGDAKAGLPDHRDVEALPAGFGHGWIAR